MARRTPFTEQHQAVVGMFQQGLGHGIAMQGQPGQVWGVGETMEVGHGMGFGGTAGIGLSENFRA